ncbi:MAG: outer membrane beta-barrel protein [Bacteroidota bacterium]|nr:outer membrane beta-barrel protein [Bacteroidota bacterium]
MKKLILKCGLVAWCLVACSAGSLGQNKITGLVVDEEQKPLPSATVVLLNPADSTMEYFGVTNEEGEYYIRNINDGTYLMQYAFVGMQSLFIDVEIHSGKSEDLGTTMMKAKPLDVEEVSVVGEYIPMVFKNDTVEFNAKAFNTKPDAVVEDLLKKLPGLEVDHSGNLRAMGEDVVKVLVDGKEFFGNDATIATKNLPADAIDKVQIYDRRSDVSQFTGIDDGVRDRTIDLKLKEDRKKGVFGDILAGLGSTEHYLASGRAFRFNQVSQIAILGNFNNINRFGVKGNDFGQAADGFNTAGSAGINLSYNPSDWNRYYMSYMANGTKSILEQETETQNFLQDLDYFETNTLNQVTRDTSHNMHFGVRARILAWQNIVANGNVNIAERNVVRQTLMNRLMNDSPVNQLMNGTNEESNSLSSNANATYIIKLDEDRTQITTKLALNGSTSFSTSNWSNSTTFYSPERNILENQFQENHNENLNATATPALVQKLNRFWYFNTHVAMGLNTHSLDRKQGIPGLTNMITDSLSPRFNRDYRFVRPGISFQRNTEKNQLNMTLGAEWSSLKQVLWDNEIKGVNFFYLKPMIRYSSQYKSGRRFGANYSTNLNLPNIGQLMPLVSILNPLSLYQGNSQLEPEFRHTLGIEWRVFDQFSFTSFFTRLSVHYTDNKIGMSRTISDDLQQYVTPVNVPWNYGGNGSFNFSTPIRPLDVEIALKLNESFNRGINIINHQDNIGSHLTHTLKFDVNNRNKNIWDAEVGASVSITDSRYSIQEDQNNRYYNFSYFGTVRWTPSEKFNIQIVADIANYNSQSFNETISIPLIGAEMNFYFLSGNRAVLTLEASDILNKNTGLTRISDINYLMQRTSNMLGRYFMASVKYRLNKVGK